jgi:hypothetical protein
MIVKDVVSRIRFQTNTNDDNTGKSANSLFTNKQLVGQLQFALDQYASYTKAIESIYSSPVSSNIRSISLPPDIIRNDGFRFIYIWRDGRKYPINIRDLNKTQTEFPNQTVSGIPRFVSVWGDQIYLYPDSDTSYLSTTLTSGILAADTTINVEDATSFPEQNGRVTINEEKIMYQTRTKTQLLNCTRGIEETSAQDQTNGDTVKENNFYVFYRKLPFKITVDSSDIIFPSDMERELEIPDEHIMSIVDFATYTLLSKVDAERAAPYKIDAGTFLLQAKQDIEFGRSDIVNATNIAGSYDWERNNIEVTL